MTRPHEQLPYFLDDVIETGRVKKGPTPSETNTQNAANTYEWQAGNNGKAWCKIKRLRENWQRKGPEKCLFRAKMGPFKVLFASLFYMYHERKERYPVHVCSRLNYCVCTSLQQFCVSDTHSKTLTDTHMNPHIRGCSEVLGGKKQFRRAKSSERDMKVIATLHMIWVHHITYKRNIEVFCLPTNEQTLHIF